MSYVRQKGDVAYSGTRSLVREPPWVYAPLHRNVGAVLYELSQGPSRYQKQNLLGLEGLTEVEATIGAGPSNALGFDEGLGRSRSIDFNDGVYCTVLVEQRE